MLKTFVCYYLPNAEVYEGEVEARNINASDIPIDAFAYEFFDRQVVEAEDGELCYGEARNRSTLTFISATVYSKHDLEELIKDMEENDVEKIIFTPSREAIFYDQDENYQFISFPELLDK